MKTGRLSGMEESYVEGLATHDGLESCGGRSNPVAEALTEVRASLVLSPEIGSTRLGCLSPRCPGRPYESSRFGEGRLDPAGSETQCVHGNNLHGNRESLWSGPGLASRVGCWESARSTPAPYVHRKSDRPIVPKKPRTRAVVRHCLRSAWREGAWPRANWWSPHVPDAVLDFVRVPGLPPVTVCTRRCHASTSAYRAGASDLRQEPSAVVPHAGICAGGAGQPAFLPRQHDEDKSTDR